MSMVVLDVNGVYNPYNLYVVKTSRKSVKVSTNFTITIVTITKTQPGRPKR